jgi:hypothetical protein
MKKMINEISEKSNICNRAGRPTKGTTTLFTERHVLNITKELEKKLKASAEENCISVLDQIRLILNKYHNDNNKNIKR